LRYADGAFYYLASVEDKLLWKAAAEKEGKKMKETRAKTAEPEFAEYETWDLRKITKRIGCWNSVVGISVGLASNVLEME
jgi:hypothetical protein